MQYLQEDLARAKASCSDRERNMMDEKETLRVENCRLKSCLEGIGQFALAGIFVSGPEQPIDGSRIPDSELVAENEPVAGRFACFFSQPVALVIETYVTNRNIRSSRVLPWPSKGNFFD